MYRKKSHIHFVGIGGIGMSGIAKILKSLGYTISGCDLDLDQKSVHDLKKLGCHIYEGNNTNHCNDKSIDILVYSSDVGKDHAEIQAAQTRGIPTIPRALMLAELMRMKYSIAIAGSHGKTTTTSLISHILMEAQYDPTVIIGGHLKSISTNAHLGNGDFLVAEADESDRSLTKLHPTLAVITNIDREHLNVYSDIDDIKNTFSQFLSNIPFYGKAILCYEDENTRSLLPLTHIKTITYGFNNLADLSAKNCTFTDTTQYDVFWHHEFLGTITLHVLGQHNVLNSLAAIAICRELDIPFATIAKALYTFKGVDRRFTFRGTFRGADLFDDYGHHPVEIHNTLLVARNRCRNKLTVIFQPHRYTRTYHLWDDFISVFSQHPIDNLIITDIYAANEVPIDNITSQNMVEALRRKNPMANITYIPLQKNTNEFDQIRENLEQNTAVNDLVLLLGAGKIYKMADLLQKYK